MNRFLLLFLIFFGLSISSVLKAETVLYCQSELATGFFKKEKKWVEGSFKKERFTLKFNQDYSTLLIPLGNRKIAMKCSIPYTAEPWFISCIEEQYPFKPFIYNKKSKRFTFAVLSSAGYVEPSTDTNSIYAGKCENF